MARKKRSRPEPAAVGAAAFEPTRAAVPAAAAGVPAEVAGSSTVLLLALMRFLAPALGVPREEMLQDTLKSIVVSFASLIARLPAATSMERAAAQARE